MAQLVEATRHNTGGAAFDSLPIPVAERSMDRVCSCSLAVITGSNSAWNMDVCVVCVVQ